MLCALRRCGASCSSLPASLKAPQCCSPAKRTPLQTWQHLQMPLNPLTGWTLLMMMMMTTTMALRAMMRIPTSITLLGSIRSLQEQVRSRVLHQLQ